ncbi:MAG TPA: SAM-dependent methyltransferase, partial [Phototrophicaceae bacterium]|nr:SAM-dependent methyltransferase [Phototrophicaceae bacterium]
MTLTIVGLGPGSVDDLTRKAWKVIANAPMVYVRTAQHPCVPDLPAVIRSFDDLYETIPDFASVYSAIADNVITAARAGDVVYAVPGDPLVAESTAIKLLERAQA